MSSESKFSRRDFLKVSALGAAGALLMPSGLAAAAKSKKNEKTAANDTINIGFIGLGQQAMHLLNGFITIDGVKVVAGCDVYDVKRARFDKRVKNTTPITAKNARSTCTKIIKSCWRVPISTRS